MSGVLSLGSDGLVPGSSSDSSGSSPGDDPSAEASQPNRRTDQIDDLVWFETRQKEAKDSDPPANPHARGLWEIAHDSDCAHPLECAGYGFYMNPNADPAGVDDDFLKCLTSQGLGEAEFTGYAAAAEWSIDDEFRADYGIAPASGVVHGGVYQPKEEDGQNHNHAAANPGQADVDDRVKLSDALWFEETDEFHQIGGGNPVDKEGELIPEKALLDLTRMQDDYTAYDYSKGMWANGRLYPWSELIQGGGGLVFGKHYGEGNTLPGREDGQPMHINGDGVAIGTATKLDEDGEPIAVGALLLPLSLRAVNPDGTLGGHMEFKTSMPSPVLDVSNVQVTTLDVDDNGAITATVQIDGELTSSLCDTIPGADGEIDELDVYVNGSEDPVTTIPVDVQKTKDVNSLIAPFPFTGTYSTPVDVELTEGLNTIKLSASNKTHGVPGYSVWTVTVTLPDDDSGGGGTGGSGSIDIAFSQPTLSPDEVDTLTLTYEIDGIGKTDLALTETGPATGVYQDSDELVSLDIGWETAFSEAEIDSFEGVLVDAEFNHGRAFHVTEASANAGLFAGDYQSFPIPAAAGGAAPDSTDGADPAAADGGATDGPEDSGNSPADATVETSYYAIDKSEGGELYPAVVYTPLDANFTQNLEASPTGDWQSDILTLIAGPNGKGSYLGHPLSPDSPMVLAQQIDLNHEDFDPEAMRFVDSLKGFPYLDKLDPISRFQLGYYYGLGAGGTELVVGTYKLFKGVGNVVGESILYGMRGMEMGWLSAKIRWKHSHGQDYNLDMTMLSFAVDEQLEVHNQIGEYATTMGNIAQQFGDWSSDAASDFIMALLTGDHQQFLVEGDSKLFETFVAIHMVAAEIIQFVYEELTNEPFEIKGYYIGRVMFEIRLFARIRG